MIAPKVLDAVALLSSLRQGQPVDVTLDGTVHRMTVSRTASRSDGQFGSIESTRVTVTFGPGRYAVEVTAERLAAGTQQLVPA